MGFGQSSVTTDQPTSSFLAYFQGLNVNTGVKTVFHVVQDDVLASAGSGGLFTGFTVYFLAARDFAGISVNTTSKYFD
jgi:hypothetical protein